MLCLSGFELYSRWVPLIEARNPRQIFRKHTFEAKFFRKYKESLKKKAL